jgi:hypothetical protein
MMAKAPGGSSLFSLYDFPSTMFATALVERSGLGNFDYISLEKKLKGKNVGISPVIGETWNGFYGNTTPKILKPCCNYFIYIMMLLVLTNKLFKLLFPKPKTN